MGLMQALEIVVPDGSRAPDPERTHALLSAARRHGVLIGKGGLHGNAVRIAPMRNVGAEDVDLGAERLEAAAEEVATG